MPHLGVRQEHLVGARVPTDNANVSLHYLRWWHLGPIALAMGCGRLGFDGATNGTPSGQAELAVYAGQGEHTCIIRSGNVQCWGRNSHGQLGYGHRHNIGDEESAASADNVPLGGPATQLALGLHHTCALRQDGAVLCWGSNALGQLGYGDRQPRGDDGSPGPFPVVDVGGPVVDLAAGQDHTCALMADGRVRCWGAGNRGQLGGASTAHIGDNEAPSSVPPIELGGDATAIAAGLFASCALMASGDVRCWGHNNGLLGLGHTDTVGDDETPIAEAPVDLDGRVEQIGMGWYHICARMAGGAVRCWGNGASGRIGSGATDYIGDDELPSEIPPVAIGDTAVDIALGANHSCVRLTDGAVRCWGQGDRGRLGYGNTRTIGDDEMPDTIGPLDLGGTAGQLAAGENYSCAVLDGRRLRCWGEAGQGQLGYGGGTDTVGDDEIPTAYPVMQFADTAVAVAAGPQHSCAILQNGRLMCWGNNSSNQLGVGGGPRIGEREPASANIPTLDDSVAQVALGTNHTCALMTDDTVRCWGTGTSGQLGYGTASSVSRAVNASTVPVGGPVTQVAAGTYHTCALLSGGTVRCWGMGDHGRLGYVDTADVGNSNTPADVGDIDVGGTVMSIACGNTHTCALLVGGTVRCWGNGDSGRLGYGDKSDIGNDETPASAGDVDVGGTVMQLAAGAQHTCALLTSGRVRCWGRGNDGQLGYGAGNSVGDDESPASAGDVDIGGIAVQIVAGAQHTCALLQGGSVRCWGHGSGGRLGYGTTVTIGDDELPSTAPVVSLGGVVEELAAGAEHTCARLAGGTVRCWGVGDYGELGLGGVNHIGDDESPRTAGDVPLAP